MLRPNPITGALEDDGTLAPADAPLALAPPTLNATPESTGGGAPVVPATSPIQIVAPPDQSIRHEVTGPTTTTRVASPESKTAFDDLSNAGARASEARETQVAAIPRIARVEALGADIEDTQAQLAEIEKQRTVAAHQEKLKQLTAAKEQRRQAEEALAKPTSYWEDRSIPARITAAFLVGLGAVGAGLTKGGNGRNGAYEIFQNAEAEDRQRKIDAFKNAKDFRILAEKDIDAAHAELTNKLAEIAEQTITKRNVMRAQIAALAKRMGIPAAQAKADEFNAKADADEAKDRAQLAQHWDKSVQSGHTTDSRTTNISGTGGKPGAPDLTALDKDGKPYGTWRTLQEAEKGRDSQAAVTGLRGSVAELNAHLQRHGRLVDPTTKEYAERQALGDNVGRFLQVLNNAGVLNPGEYERNRKSVNSTLFKSGENAAHANELMVSSAERTYDAALKAKAVRTQADGAPSSQPVTQAPAAPAPARKAGGVQTRELNGRRFVKSGGQWREIEGGAR